MNTDTVLYKRDACFGLLSALVAVNVFNLPHCNEIELRSAVLLPGTPLVRPKASYTNLLSLAPRLLAPCAAVDS
jgi:hypothetical protein